MFYVGRLIWLLSFAMFSLTVYVQVAHSDWSPPDLLLIQIRQGLFMIALFGVGIMSMDRNHGRDERQRPQR